MIENKKTREDVEELKSQWVKDPHWDIEDTDDGFEEYRDELITFHKEQKAKWHTAWLEANTFSDLIGQPDPQYTRDEAMIDLTLLEINELPAVSSPHGLYKRGTWEIFHEGELTPERQLYLDGIAEKLRGAGLFVSVCGDTSYYTGDDWDRRLNRAYGVRWYNPIKEEAVTRGSHFRLEMLNISSRNSQLDQAYFERTVSAALKEGWQIQAANYAESQDPESLSQTYVVALIKPV